MKKLFFTLSVGTALAAMLAGCATTQQAQGQAILASFCADVVPFNALIKTIPNVGPKVTTDLAVAAPIVAAACVNGATLNATTTQTLLATGFPLILDVVDALPSTPEVKVIIADIQLAQVILPGVLALIPPASTAAAVK